MCDPLTIAATALMAGGSYANYRGQKQVQKANLNVRRAEDARQAGYKQQAELAYAKNKDLYDPERAKADMQGSAKKRTDAYTKANMAAPRAAAAATSGAMGGNKVVQEANAARLADGTARAAEHGEAGAQLLSLGDMLFGADLVRGRNRDDINMSANFARGSLNPMGAELDAASMRGDKMKALGSLLTTAGSGMMGAAGAGSVGPVSPTTNIGPFADGYILPFGSPGSFIPQQTTAYGLRLPNFGG